jgi:hypothetical protein
MGSMKPASRVGSEFNLLIRDCYITGIASVMVLSSQKELLTATS